MSKRPKCAFTDCDNPVMKGETTGRLLSVCQECYERNRMFEFERMGIQDKHDDPETGGCKAVCRVCGRTALWADMFRFGDAGWTCGQCWYGHESYLILCTKQRAHGGYALWWGPEGRGYYAELEAAGRYTKEEAERICRGIEAHPVPLKEAMGMAVTVADYPMPRQEGSSR